ncbi:MAG: hypothetical protein QOD53_1704 [Thermoleophilaceae bacterium]|jgi:hypothetical protein|nr:hypothetical protein [Thermoleophilaceae bacterium]
MEAATPLRQPNVRTVGDRLVVDGLIVSDESAVRLVREREEAGDDGVKVVSDAIEIGARVLDREQAGANADFVRSEFDRTARDVETAFAERATQVAEELGRKVDEFFGPDSGHVTKALERHFSDESDASVQNRVRDAIKELTASSREELLKQFSAEGGHNPLADFKASAVAVLKDGAERQDRTVRQVTEQMAALKVELQALRDERDKHDAVDAEREKGSAKGRTFEEQVFEAVDAIAAVQGDDCDAVGDLREATGKTGDVVVAIDACRGPARGRIVFEAKNAKLSKPKAFAELDRGMHERNADFGVLVVPVEDKLPAKTSALREYNGDKLLVAYHPEAGERLPLEVAYSLARARVLMSRAEGDGLDVAALRDTVERALGVMEDVRRIKQQLTGAETGIDSARSILDGMADRVRAHLREIETLASAGSPEASPQASLLE